jgi:hypothetical protein
MPRIKRKTKRALREWNLSHKMQLRSGHDFFGDAWGDAHQLERQGNPGAAKAWPDKDTLDDMIAAWEHFRSELMEETKDSLTRPWAWWEFDAPEEIGEDGRRWPTECQADYLDARGMLTPKALAIAEADPQITHAVRNEAYEPGFERSWGWWRFLAPQRRDHEVSQAMQLVAMYRDGEDVLTKREKYVIEHGVDDPFYKKCSSVLLPRADVLALGLNESLIDPYFDEDDEE